MTTTERLMAVGSFTFDLAEDTPSDIIQMLDVRRVAGTLGWAVVSITPSPIDGAERLGPSASPTTVPPPVMHEAIYTGFLRETANDRHTLIGIGLLSSWGDDDDSDPKGDYLAFVGPFTLTFTQWATLLLTGGTFTDDNAISRTIPAPWATWAGTVTAPGSTPTLHTFGARTTRKAYLQRFCSYYGIEYAVRSNGFMDIGPPSALYNVTPTTVVVRRAQGSELLRDTFGTEGFDAQASLADYANTVVYINPDSNTVVGAAVLSDIGKSDPFRGPKGTLQNLTRRVVDNFFVNPGDADLAAQFTLGSICDITQRFTVSGTAYEWSGPINVGDNVYIWDRMLGLTDTSNFFTFRGESIYPMISRIYGIERPIGPGHGVYLTWYDNSGVFNTLDLSPWYVPEDASGMRLEIGAPAPRLVA